MSLFADYEDSAAPAAAAAAAAAGTGVKRKFSDDSDAKTKELLGALWSTQKHMIHDVHIFKSDWGCEWAVSAASENALKTLEGCVVKHWGDMDELSRRSMLDVMERHLSALSDLTEDILWNAKPAEHPTIAFDFTAALDRLIARHTLKASAKRRLHRNARHFKTDDAYFALGHSAVIPTPTSTPADGGAANEAPSGESSEHLTDWEEWEDLGHGAFPSLEDVPKFDRLNQDDLQKARERVQT